MANFNIDDLDDVLDGINDQLADLDSEITILRRGDTIHHGRPKSDPHSFFFTDASIEDFHDLDSLLRDLSQLQKPRVTPVSPALISALAINRPPVPGFKPSVAPAGPTLQVPGGHMAGGGAGSPRKGKGGEEAMEILFGVEKEMGEREKEMEKRIREIKIQEAQQQLRDANIKKLNLRIYMGDNGAYRTLSVTSLMDTEAVVTDIVYKAYLQEDPTWSLYECVYELGIERPLKSYEKLTDTIATWDADTTSSIIFKKNPRKEALNKLRFLDEFPSMCGVMYFQTTKKSKWYKRYFEIKLSGFYHYKDTKMSQEKYLCNWKEYEAYEVFAPRKKAPSKWCFSLRRQEPLSTNVKENYVIYLCVETEDILHRWLTAFNNAKNRLYVESNPELQLQGKKFKLSPVVDQPKKVRFPQNIAAAQEDSSTPATTLSSRPTRPAPAPPSSLSIPVTTLAVPSVAPVAARPAEPKPLPPLPPQTRAQTAADNRPKLKPVSPFMAAETEITRNPAFNPNKPYSPRLNPAVEPVAFTSSPTVAAPPKPLPAVPKINFTPHLPSLVIDNVEAAKEAKVVVPSPHPEPLAAPVKIFPTPTPAPALRPKPSVNSLAKVRMENEANQKERDELQAKMRKIAAANMIY